MGDSFKGDFGTLLNRDITPSALLQPADVAAAVLMAVTAPPSCCITELEVAPQRDLFRQRVFTQPQRVDNMLVELERKTAAHYPEKPPCVAIVTGAGRGIGALARRCARKHIGINGDCRTELAVALARDAIQWR